MTLSELNTPQLIFLEVSCFFKLCRGENTSADFDGFEVLFDLICHLQRETIAIFNSNTPQPISCVETLKCDLLSPL